MLFRSGASGSLDFRPTKEDSFYVRGTYNHFSDTENRFRELFRNEVAQTVAQQEGVDDEMRHLVSVLARA